MIPSYRVMYSLRSLGDLERIHDHIGADVPLGADHMVEKIVDAIDELSFFPYRPVANVKHVIREPARLLVVVPYLIYYRLNESTKTVSIIHIRHSSRRPLRRL